MFLFCNVYVNEWSGSRFGGCTTE